MSFIPLVPQFFFYKMGMKMIIGLSYKGIHAQEAYTSNWYVASMQQQLLSLFLDYKGKRAKAPRSKINPR